MVELCDEDFARLTSIAAMTGRTESDLIASSLKLGLEVAEVRHQIDRFSSLSLEQRQVLSARAEDIAAGAQMMAWDANDGGYDWGPAGPPLNG